MPSQCMPIFCQLFFFNKVTHVKHTCALVHTTRRHAHSLTCTHTKNTSTPSHLLFTYMLHSVTCCYICNMQSLSTHVHRRKLIMGLACLFGSKPNIIMRSSKNTKYFFIAVFFLFFAVPFSSFFSFYNTFIIYYE